MTGGHIISREDASEGDIAEGERPMGWHAGGDFASDVLKLVGGTAFAQALAVLALPIITRMYGPEAFGLSALFASLVGIIGVVACLRYETAIMLPNRDEEAANLLGLSLIIAAFMSILLVPIIWVGQEPLLRLLNAPELAPCVWLTLPAVFLSGVFLSLKIWNLTMRHFKRYFYYTYQIVLSTKWIHFRGHLV